MKKIKCTANNCDTYTTRIIIIKKGMIVKRDWVFPYVFLLLHFFLQKHICNLILYNFNLCVLKWMLLFQLLRLYCCCHSNWHLSVFAYVCVFVSFIICSFPKYLANISPIFFFNRIHFKGRENQYHTSITATFFVCVAILIPMSTRKFWFLQITH